MAVWENLGITLNIPHAGSWSTYTANVGDDFMGELEWLGLSKFRVTFIAYGSSGSRTAMKLYFEQVRQHFPNAYLIFGTTCSPGVVKITSSNWADYAAQTLEDAVWSERAGADEYVIGNEMENSYNNDGTLSAQQIRDNMKALAEDVQAVFSGVVSYNVAQGQEDGWISDGKGDFIDKLGFNVYGEDGGWASFKAYMDELYTAFGANCYISEWSGSDPTWDNTSLGGITDTSIGFDDAYAEECKRRLDYMRTKGISSAYLFTNTWFEPTARDEFAMRQYTGGYRKALSRLLERRHAYKYWGN